MSSHTPECRALSAPCLREKYPTLRVPTAGAGRGLKRTLEQADGGQLAILDSRKEANRLRNAKKKANKKTSYNKDGQ